VTNETAPAPSDMAREARELDEALGSEDHYACTFCDNCNKILAFGQRQYERGREDAREKCKDALTMALRFLRAGENEIEGAFDPKGGGNG
jgi:hypothetical protein